MGKFDDLFLPLPNLENEFTVGEQTFFKEAPDKAIAEGNSKVLECVFRDLMGAEL